MDWVDAARLLSPRVLADLLDEAGGRHHHLNIDDLGIRPHQARVPILVGGHGRRVIDAAAPVADIFHSRD